MKSIDTTPVIRSGRLNRRDAVGYRSVTPRPQGPGGAAIGHFTLTDQLSKTITIRDSVAGRGEWDGFAQRCGTSFRGSYHAARAWQAEHHLRFRLRRLDVFRGRTKIGQCAIGVGARLAVFSDGLQLLPTESSRWPAAIAAVLAVVGPGEYVYGSEWSVEPCRANAFASVAGVGVAEVAATEVQVIEFARWPTFEAYQRATSTNVRRNVKKAAKSYGRLELLVTPGVGDARTFARSLWMRRALFMRKGVERSTLGMAMRSVARLSSLHRYSHAAQLYADGDVVASYNGVTFGDVYAYLEGASDPGGRGTSWYLLMAMIERAFAESSGRGRFIMGSDDGTQAGIEAWEGLRRSRRQCCATPVATSVVRFVYRTPTPDASLIDRPRRDPIVRAAAAAGA